MKTICLGVMSLALLGCQFEIGNQVQLQHQSGSGSSGQQISNFFHFEQQLPTDTPKDKTDAEKQKDADNTSTPDS